MKIQNGADALAGSARPKKAIERFYITHPKVSKVLPGSLLTEADAECGRVVIHNADAVIKAYLVDLIDELTYWHGVNNDRVRRAFAGADRQAGTRHD